VVRPRPSTSRAGPVVAVGLVAAAAVALVVTWRIVSRPKKALRPRVAATASPLPDDAAVDIPFDGVRLDEETWFTMELMIPGEWSEARTRALFVARTLLVRAYADAGTLHADYPDAKGRGLMLRVVAEEGRDRLARLLVAEVRASLGDSGISLAMAGERPSRSGPKLLPDFVCVEEDALVVGLVVFLEWKDGMVEEVRARLYDRRRSLKFGTWTDDLPETANPKRVRIKLYTLFLPRAEDLAALERLREQSASRGLDFAVQRLEPESEEREFLIPNAPE